MPSLAALVHHVDSNAACWPQEKQPAQLCPSRCLLPSTRGFCRRACGQLAPQRNEHVRLSNLQTAWRANCPAQDVLIQVGRAGHRRQRGGMSAVRRTFETPNPYASLARELTSLCASHRSSVPKPLSELVRIGLASRSRRLCAVRKVQQEPTREIHAVARSF